MDAPSWVHIGSWTDWEYGAVSGARITVREQYAAYLIAFLALFVRLAGQHSWDIICFLYFRLRQSSSRKDDFYHGQQVILRNTLTHTSGIWQFLRLGWRQRSTSENAMLRSFGLISFALLHLLAFTFAGIFVSRVTDTGSEVLLRGPVCGEWRDPGAWGEYISGSPADSLENSLYAIEMARITFAASRFSEECYNTTSSQSTLSNCEAYGPRQIQWNVSTDIGCPFAPEMCKNNTAVRFDTGLLDSQHDFGINSSPGDRVKYRRVVQCAPIIQKGFASDFLNYSQVQLPNITEIPFKVSITGHETFQEFNYGPNVDLDMNSTFIWFNTSVLSNIGNMGASAFLLDSELATLQNEESSTFLTNEQMNRTDADVVMYFLLNNAIYLDPVYDPWFQATTPSTYGLPSILLGGAAVTDPHYQADYAASVMGCTQQFQYCNHDGSKCSALTGSAAGAPMPEAMVNFQDGLDLNDKQIMVQERLYQASWTSDMYYANFVPVAQNLLASSAGMANNFMPAFPDNQWVLEMQHLFLLGLTSMQMQIAEYVTGPPHSNAYQYLHKAQANETWMCNNQIVQRAGYTTFSSLGLALVMVLGGLLILINLAITIRTTYRPTNEWDKFYNLNLFYEAHGTSATRSQLHFIDDKHRQDSENTQVGEHEPETTVLSYVNSFSNSEANSSNDMTLPNKRQKKVSHFREIITRTNTDGTTHVY